MRGLCAVLLLAACGDDSQAIPDAAPIDAHGDAPADAAPLGCAPGDGGAATICTVDHLCWANPLPQGMDINAIGGADCDYWLGGGALYRMKGDTLSPVPLDGTLDISALDVFPSSVWIAGRATGAQRFDGAQWTKLANDTSGVFGVAPDDVWVTANQGMVMHWDGTTLSPLAQPMLTQLGAGQVYAAAANDVRVLDSGLPIHLDGATWTRETLPGQYDTADGIWGAAPNDWYAVGGNYPTGYVWHWNGSAWSVAYSETPASGYVTFHAIWGSGPSDVWAGGFYLDHVMHFDGNTWSRVALSTMTNVYAIHGTNASDVVFGGLNGYLARWNGSQLRELSSAYPLAVDENGWQGVWGASANDVWVIGDHGSTLHFDGVRWTPGRLIPQTGGATAIHGTASDDVWAAGATLGRMYVFHWNGSAWTATDLGITGAALRSIWAAARNDVWAAGDGGVIWHFDGNTWMQKTSTTTMVLHGIWGTNASAWAVGDIRTILRWNGSNWSAVTPPAGSDYWSVWGRAADDVYIGGFAGELLHWNGQALTEMTRLPVSPVLFIGGDASRMWVAGDRYLALDDGGGLRRLSVPQKEWWGAFFPSPSDGWVVGHDGAILRYQP